MYPVPARGVVAFCEWRGRLSVVDPSSGTVEVVGRGYRAPESVVVTSSGSTAFVSERGGGILTVDLANADRANALPLAGPFTAPHQLALSSDEKHVLVVEFTPTGRLLRIDLASGSADALVSGLEWAVGLAVTAGGDTAYVTEQRQGGGRLTRVDLATGATGTVLDGLVAPFFLSWLDASEEELVLIERDPANRLTVVEAATGTVRTQLAGLPFRPSSAVRLDDRLLVGCDREIVEFDLGHGLGPRVELHMPGRPMFVGGYARVPVDLGTSGLDLDDLRFEVPDGPLAGSISLSRDPTFDPAHPEIMLLGGSEPGTWPLVAIEAATGTVVGEGSFTTTAEWDDEGRSGPAVAFLGRTESFVAGAAWGGGPAGPQNVNVFPASGTRRVAVILVDTSTARYPTTGVALPAGIDDPLIIPIKAEWQNELMGTVPDPDLVVRSTRGYYQEASAGRFDLALVGNAIAGPFALPGSWTDYFTWDADNSIWWFNGNLPQVCVTAAQAQIDFDQVDTLVMVMNSVPATATQPAQFAWPAANGGNLTYTRPGAATPTQRNFPYLCMPVDWEAVDTRRIHETLAHEIGHNLGMGDLYMSDDQFSPDMQARDVQAWDLMSWENPLPHISLAHRMMLGWVDPAWVRSFDFSTGGGADVTVTLQAIESIPQSGPPAGRWAGVEVRRADGWNYYFEYRAGQVTQFGDRNLPVDQRVLGTDVISATYTAPQTRRQIILLANDPDNDGPVLGGGADYEEPDPSGPALFQFDVVSTAADNAVVRIRYGAGGRPDPSIRPWPGGAVWQSPDIEVRNARNAADPAWFNVPWAGNTNTVVAKVKNSGDFAAVGVRVDFSVKDYTVGNAPETGIGSDTQDIPVGATVEFTTTWAPPANTPTDDAHYCVIARIPLYQDPGNPAIVELSELNNLAQSNYTRFISASASPSSRGMTAIKLTNPYSRRTRVSVLAQQSTPWYRTYLEHQWVWLEPGEERSVGVMYESLVGDPAFDLSPEMVWKRPSRCSLVGLVENTLDPVHHCPEVMGGAEVQLASGRATRIEGPWTDDKVVRGRVVTVDGGDPVGEGVVVVLRRGDGEAEVAIEATVDNGEFVAELGAAGGPSRADVQAYYTGGHGYADCWSNPAGRGDS
jgi:M6 family metalloprotease-like protein